MAEDLQGRVRGWLQNQGYPFELRMGRELRKAGWLVEHSRWYVDPDLGKQRELDLFATTASEMEPGPSIKVCLAVECKSSKDKPWVVFSSPRSALPADSIAGDYASRVVLKTAQAAGVDLPPSMILAERIAHSATRVFEGADSGAPTGPFAAFRGVLAAVKSIGDEFGKWLWEGGSVVPLILPLVVVEGRLFDYFVTDDGTEELKEIDKMYVATPMSSDDGMVNVGLVTERVFPDVVAQLRSEVDSFSKSLVPQYPQIRIEIERHWYGDYGNKLEDLGRREAKFREWSASGD